MTILQCLSDVLQKDTDTIQAFDPNAPLSDLGLSSLSMIRFIVLIEEALDMEIRDSDLLYENFETINKIFETLSHYLKPSTAIKKCLIVDADNVLWHGISGEEEIVFDDAIVGFQDFLLDLYRRGVLLCLCSKNDEALIRISFSHPVMRLTPAHFAIFLANRTDKVSNIATVADELNLSYDSMVFADDSDYELGFVSLNLPEVTTIKVNHATTDTLSALRTLFEAVQPTSDLNRTQLYKEQKEREKEKRNFTSVEDYNRSLETVITCGPAKVEELSRLAELSVRTHQFNLSAVSYTEEMLRGLMQSNDTSVYSLSVKDKYGDMGIVGMAVVKNDTIEAFMLSCRVFDRDLESVLLQAIKEEAAAPLCGIYRPNGKNERFADFYLNHGVRQI